MVTVSFEYYTDTYLGDVLNEAAFNRGLKRVRPLVNVYTFGRVGILTDGDLASDSILNTSVKECFCRCAEIWDSYKDTDGRAVSSETVGPVSRVFSDSGVPVSLDKDISRAVDNYLGNTGLTYCGLC